VKAAILLASASIAGCGDDAAPDSGPDAGGVDAALPADASVPDADGEDAGDGGSTDAAPDQGVDAAPERPCDGPPGLYVDAACQRLARDLAAYDPQFWLWSDGTDKERYIALPEGATIDASRPDGWVFPVGTRVYKTFLLEGVRLETRYFEKVREDEGIGAWEMRTYAWNEAQDRAVEVTEGATDVLGTGHDIPAVALCAHCHAGGGQPDVLLGFSALQLNHSGSALSLDGLNAAGVLAPPVSPAQADIPSTDPTVRAALGYLHANCGHCHGGFVPRAGLELFVRSGLPSLEETGVYRSAVGRPSAWTAPGATLRVAPGDPDGSTLTRRMGMRGSAQMPPLATERIDPTGLEAVRAWIAALPVGG